MNAFCPKQTVDIYLKFVQCHQTMMPVLLEMESCSQLSVKAKSKPYQLTQRSWGKN